MAQHGLSEYRPRTGFERWLDERLPLPRFLWASFVAYPTPRNLNYLYTFGAILTVMMISQILTGVVLAMHYVSDPDRAFQSVEFIMRDVNYGWLLRYMHAVGASMYFLAAFIHTFRALYYGSYKSPREVLWILGVLILFTMMATAFMGYVLPWGQMSLWGATVITSFFTAIPWVGGAVQEWLLGGFAVGGPTLNRFFALHYLMPFITAALVGLHIWALHVVGQTNPTGVPVQSTADVVPFTPHATIKDTLAVIVFLLVFAYFVFYHPNYLGHPDNYQPGDPLVTPPHIVPEWYFLPFYAILRAVTFDIGPISSKLGGVIAMFASIAILFFLPWLDTSKVRSARYRPLYKQFFWIFVACCIGLGWLGSRPAEGGYVVAAQILTAYYFLHFLVIMPLLGLYETPRPRPASIAESVLKGRREGAHPAQPVGSTAAPQVKG